jgi:hypothetical protein
VELGRHFAHAGRRSIYSTMAYLTGFQHNDILDKVCSAFLDRHLSVIINDRFLDQIWYGCIDYIHLCLVARSCSELTDVI